MRLTYYKAKTRARVFDTRNARLLQYLLRLPKKCPINKIINMLPTHLTFNTGRLPLCYSKYYYTHYTDIFNLRI